MWLLETRTDVFVITGDLVYTYLSLGYRNPVTDVAFHPFENMVAFCSYGENHLMKIYMYDHKGNFRNSLLFISCSSGLFNDKLVSLLCLFHTFLFRVLSLRCLENLITRNFGCLDLFGTFYSFYS